MAGNKAMYTGVQQIMDAFDRNAQTPFYSVWSGKDMLFSWNEEDEQKGREFLLENLIASEQNGHSDILKIKFHPKKERTFITDKTPAIATLFVRVCETEWYKNQQSLQPAYSQPAHSPVMERLMAQQTEILSGLSNRLSALEEVQMQEEEDDDDQEDDTLGKIGTILNHPAVMALISAIAPNVINAMKPQAQPMVAGTPQEEVIDEMEEYAPEEIGVVDFTQEEELMANQHTINQINQALERLAKHTDSLGADLTALADMADHNPAQFKMLLGMLRK